MCLFVGLFGLYTAGRLAARVLGVYKNTYVLIFRHVAAGPPVAGLYCWGSVFSRIVAVEQRTRRTMESTRRKSQPLLLVVVAICDWRRRRNFVCAPSVGRQHSAQILKAPTSSCCCMLAVAWILKEGVSRDPRIFFLFSLVWQGVQGPVGYLARFGVWGKLVNTHIIVCIYERLLFGEPLRLS